MAARRYLPPGANVCVAAPANQTSSAIGVFFRISESNPSPQLEVGSLDLARGLGLGSAISFPAGSGAEPQPTLNLVHFRL